VPFFNQKASPIFVIIGNPPYNVGQESENENNKNREYPEIDKRIKETYIEESTAQKTKLYDMYARFFRWASDRLDENGVLAFITNRGFIDRRTYDGFRKIVAGEFTEIYVVDLGGDVRDNPILSGTKHNVFGIQTGVAISLLVRKRSQKQCRIFYARRPELETAEEKLAYLNAEKLHQIVFEELRPDAKHNWINLAETDFDSLIPLAAKESKATRKSAQEKTIFKLFSLGVVTARDEWVYDEGCLSIPGLYFELVRPKEIHLTGYDLDGNEVSIEADELLARLFQHELDHLDGKLMLEMLDAEQRREALRELRRRAIEPVEPGTPKKRISLS
jgi:predicted helicase